MIDPGTSAWFHVTPDTSDASCNTGSSIPEAVNQDTRCSSHHYGTDVVFQALKLAETLPSDSTNETVLFQALMNEIITLPVTTVVHIPRSVRPLLAQVLSSELSHARLHGIWGFARFHLFAKAVLRCPPRGGRKKRLVVKSILLTRLKRWQEGDLIGLWEEARVESALSQKSKPTSVAQQNSRRAALLAGEGRFRDAMRSLGSLGCATTADQVAVEELMKRHPENDLPDWNSDIPPPLTVSSASVLEVSRNFPRGTSPGGSKFRCQHLLDAVDGTAPSAADCLENLTLLICFLLSGRADTRISPWLTGAPLTALYKRQGGVRPIAVGEILRRITSRLCCSAVKPRLPEFFLPSGQVGVGIKGGLEAAVHTLSGFIESHGDNPDLCCVKIDFSNAFNECQRSTFLRRVQRDFPEIFAWCQWCYHCAGELRFGNISIKSTTGVQQGDPLGPLLFSLVVLDVLDSIGQTPGLTLQLWYLDDGTFVGSRTAVSSLLNKLSLVGPSHGLLLNMNKCEVFWPTGDASFPEFPAEIQRIQNSAEGLELLGSPVYGSDRFFDTFLAKRIDKVRCLQDLLPDLKDPQIELHLLRSCMGVCKINHLLRTVPSNRVEKQLVRFDYNIRSCLETISLSSISDVSWAQATLPIRLGGLGLRSAERSSTAAFIGSCNGTRLLSAQLLENCLENSSMPFNHDSTFPGELLMRDRLSHLYIHKQ